MQPGEIIGLVGPNGAGKSTFGRVLVGEIPFGGFGGELKLKGEVVRFFNSKEAHESGVTLVHQEGAALSPETNFLGDIAISPATARRNAKKYNRTLPSELQILILHGVLHLLGYDHETDSGQMTRIEHRLRRKLGLS